MLHARTDRLPVYNPRVAYLRSLYERALGMSRRELVAGRLFAFRLGHYDVELVLRHAQQDRAGMRGAR